MTQWKDAEAFRFGKAACRECGHHPIMHLSEQEILTGTPAPCKGAAEGEPPCTCVGYKPSPQDEPSLIPIGGPSLDDRFRLMFTKCKQGQGVRGPCTCGGSVALGKYADGSVKLAHSPPPCAEFLSLVEDNPPKAGQS